VQGRSTAWGFCERVIFVPLRSLDWQVHVYGEIKENFAASANPGLAAPPSTGTTANHAGMNRTHGWDPVTRRSYH
jgi:hypothetical protein